MIALCQSQTDCQRRKFRSINSVLRTWKRTRKPIITDITSPQQCITTTIHHHNNTSPQQYNTTAPQHTSPHHHTTHHRITTTPRHGITHITTSPRLGITTSPITTSTLHPHVHINTPSHDHIRPITTSAHHRDNSSPQHGITASHDDRKVQLSGDEGKLVCATGGACSRARPPCCRKS